MNRHRDIVQFYSLLDELRARLGGVCLRDCSGSRQWPPRGVYFFFEAGEQRTTSGSGPRVVRVGTHAITATSRTTLWNRLSQHRGVASSGGGNHRGSIFRLLVGEALVRRDALEVPSWGVCGSRSAAAERLGLPQLELRTREAPVEVAVSNVIGAMPFVWVSVDDAPGPESLRALIERNSIALLSNSGKDPADPSTGGWLGLHSGRDRVRLSGLWNNNHVDETYDPLFLDVLARAIERAKRPS